jgi:hypothetical protein
MTTELRTLYPVVREIAADVETRFLRFTRSRKKASPVSSSKAWNAGNGWAGIRASVSSRC